MILVQGMTCSLPPCSAGSRAAAASCLQPCSSCSPPLLLRLPELFSNRYEPGQDPMRTGCDAFSGLQRWGCSPSSGRVRMDLFASSKRGRLHRAVAPAAKELLTVEARNPFTMRPLGRERGAISGKRQSPETSRRSASMVPKEKADATGSSKWPSKVVPVPKSIYMP